MTAEELTHHINHNYGHCLLDVGETASPNCLCVRPGQAWRGLDCGNWTPCGADDWTELAGWMNAKREKERSNEHLA